MTDWKNKCHPWDPSRRHSKGECDVQPPRSPERNGQSNPEEKMIAPRILSGVIEISSISL